MIVLFQRALAPYRVSLFNCLHDALNGEFTLVLSRRDPTPDRRWTIPWSEVAFPVVVLPGNRLDVGRGTAEVSRSVRATLERLQPEAIVLGGWDVHACWTALWWARRHGVPPVSWVETAQCTGSRRGVVSSAVRGGFLRACSAAIVPGVAAEAFVHQLAAAIPCHHAPNSVDAPDLRAIGEPPPQGAALFMGELSRRKGVDLVLGAAAEILTMFPRLIIAGDGPLRRDVTAVASRLPGVEYAGFVEGPEKARLFERSAVVLIPSRRDPWPLVACEAMVGRRPIVVGPGVASRPDLQRIAGEAVSAMSAATARDLAEAARRVKGQVVPPGLSTAFGPEAVAAAMAAAARSVVSQVGAGA